MSKASADIRPKVALCNMQHTWSLFYVFFWPLVICIGRRHITNGIGEHPPKSSSVTIWCQFFWEVQAACGYINLGLTHFLASGVRSEVLSVERTLAPPNMEETQSDVPGLWVPYQCARWI